jgi:glycosyltransferase involved in cell wall biosynthesis
MTGPAIEIETDPSILFPATDAFVPFKSDRAVGVWAYRDRDWDFQLPLVSYLRAYYGAFPHAPGMMDVPVDSVMVCGSPRVMVDGVEYASVGVPDRVEHGAGQLQATYSTFVPVNAEPLTPPLSAYRKVAWRVEKRSIIIDEAWTFPSKPSAIYYMIPESQRPLQVRFESDVPHDASVVEVSGMPMMRGYFSPITRLHQVNFTRFDPQICLRTTITPSIRVAHCPADHDYNRGIYDAMPAGAIAEVRRLHNGGSPHSSMNVQDFSGDADIVHLGWFEHLLGRQLMEYPALIDRVVLLVTRLRGAGKKIVWTMHNRRPHAWPPEDGRALYRAVAPLVDAAIHHSHCGMKLMLSELPYRPDCRHVVIPHGHFGQQMQIEATRASLEEKFKLQPCAIRFGVLGRYQPEKQIEQIIRAFRSVNRPDQQLVLTAYKEGIDLGDAGDSRIVRLPRNLWMTRSEIAEHNKLCDALVSAHTGDTYLTSGVAADAIGIGLAMVCPAWDYFREIVGKASIEYDGTEQGLSDLFASVTPDQIHQAQLATASLREAYSFDRVARLHFELFESLL